MASAYPGGLDSFTNPVSTDLTNSVTVPHATQHADLNDAVEAIQAELGLNPSGASATVVARLGAATATEFGYVAGVTSAIQTQLDAKAPLASPTLVTPTLGVASATTVNKVTITAPATGSTLTVAEGSSLITSGAYATTLTATGATNVTLPTTGTLATLAGSETLSNKTLTAPALGAATATSIVSSGPISGGLKGNLGAAPTVASATTIAPTTAVVLVSGTTTIETITAPAPIDTLGGTITIIPTGIFVTGVTDNIALASTSVVSKALHMTYDPTTTKWYPSY